MSDFSTTPAGLYAFWPYDQFPFLCSGPVTHMASDGRVYTENFGRGFAFQPVKLLPIDAGLTLKTRLKDLELERRGAFKALEIEYAKRLAALLTPVGIKLQP
jgi:hypothetical protein